MECLSEHGKIYWHDAHYEALQLEFYDYKDVPIDKNIGKIFKNHNIVEYKSETDNFDIWDFEKVLGYAHIYSSFEKVPISNITILSSEDMFKTLQLYRKHRALNDKNILLSRLARANPEAYLEAIDMFSEDLRTLFLEGAERYGWTADLEIEKAKRIAKKLLMLGDSPEKVANATELPIDTVIEICNSF